MRKNSVRYDGGFYGGAPDGRPPGKDKSEKYIPEKNIKVVDEYGNDYGATWPRRAKGLIKSGRAREIGENIICLTRPPNKKELQAMEH
ncbi:MAG: hypothetical protein LBK23_11880, partial [Oscillospiraceae bacterium]|nr:hypothetical protein [Oscillospiraceae bacterium]